MEKRFMGRAENEEEELIILRLKIYTIYTRKQCQGEELKRKNGQNM